MYLSRIRFDPGRASLADLVHAGRADGYRLHQAIWRLFSGDANAGRDFLYRHDPAHGLPGYYTLSAREPQDPAGRWRIESKPFAPKLKAGDRLAFMLTVNPVVSRRDTDGRQHRHDVVMDRKRAYPADARPPMGELIREAGLQCLAGRSEALGFRFRRDDVVVCGYRQHRLYKAAGVSPIRISTLDLDGLLTVDEPRRFVDEALYRGIGPAKGFGCGLLLVRRA